MTVRKTKERDLEDIEVHDGSGHGHGFYPHAFEHDGELWLVAFDDTAGAEEAEDARGSEEGAEHEGDSAIFLEMADGLVARASGIDIGSLIGREDGEGSGRFRGDVDVFTSERG